MSHPAKLGTFARFIAYVDPILLVPFLCSGWEDLHVAYRVAGVAG